MGQENRSDRSRRLAELADAMENAEDLTRLRNDQRLVFGRGNASAGLVLIGEAPGAQEARQGRPFVGPAGKLLDDALERVGLDSDAVWITNVVKFRPTTPGIGGGLKNRPPTREEVQAFFPWLERELELIQPQALLCLGGTAATAILGRTVRVTAERGNWLVGPRDLPTLVTYHPAFMLRRMPGWEEKFEEFVEDIRLAAERA